jgi:hypothetical protein
MDCPVRWDHSCGARFHNEGVQVEGIKYDHVRCHTSDDKGELQFRRDNTVRWKTIVEPR